MSARVLKIKPDPDFGRLERVLTQQGLPDRVPFFELLSNLEAQVLEVIGAQRVVVTVRLAVAVDVV